MADDNDIAALRRLLRDCRRIAVVGISAEWHRPSFFVAKYLLEHGYTMKGARSYNTAKDVFIKTVR